MELEPIELQVCFFFPKGFSWTFFHNSHLCSFRILYLIFFFFFKYQINNNNEYSRRSSYRKPTVQIWTQNGELNKNMGRHWPAMEQKFESRPTMAINRPISANRRPPAQPITAHERATISQGRKTTSPGRNTTTHGRKTTFHGRKTVGCEIPLDGDLIKWGNWQIETVSCYDNYPFPP